MDRWRRIPFLLALALLLPWGSRAQDAGEKPPEPVLLTVSGEVEHPLRLTASDLSRLSRRTVRAAEHGKEAVFEGVALGDVLRMAGVPAGESLRGKQLVKYLLVDARDGYQAIFALPELDGAFTDREVLLADRRDGKPLAETEGPLRLVVPAEKRPARWVRQVQGLRIGNVNGERCP
jgi:DMSO/TMAO reductase YedYZ molybdopterin-dependent catalytic subunit